jgi:hypothetical protein
MKPASRPTLLGLLGLGALAAEAVAYLILSRLFYVPTWVVSRTCKGFLKWSERLHRLQPPIE